MVGYKFEYYSQSSYTHMYIHTYSIHNLHFMVHHWIDYQLLHSSIHQKSPPPTIWMKVAPMNHNTATVPLACTHQEVKKQKIG